MLNKTEKKKQRQRMADRVTDLEKEDQGTKSKTRTTTRVLIHPKRQGRGVVGKVVGSLGSLTHS